LRVNRRRFLVGLGATALGAAGVLAVYSLNKTVPPEPLQTTTQTNLISTTETGTVAFRVETFLENLTIPWSIAFAQDGRAFFTERVGRINLLRLETRKFSLFAEVPVANIGEGGLLGLALSPDFESDHLVYVYHTYEDAVGVWNRVIRYRDNDGVGVNPEAIIDRIPGAGIHDGGRIRFGPDRKLYVTTGDAANGSHAQNLESLAGKILRLNPDGSVPADNPFTNSPVYSFGHRNPQGIDWHPVTGRMFETEHGPTGEGGRFANDEVNVVEPGKNYGWPVVVCISNDSRFVNPIFCTGDNVTWAPSGCSFYSGNMFPDWRNSFFVATLRGIHLHRFIFNPQTNRIQESERLLEGALGRLRDAVQGPDGLLYVLTSNRDGRGSPAPNDDRILRLVPL
jgi:glucose/arabinose dehydrogenase